VPQVASETRSQAVTTTQTRTYRTQPQQSERTDSSPFQSMLDDTAAASDATLSDDTGKAAPGQQSQAASKPGNTDAKDASATDKAQEAKNAKNGQNAQDRTAAKAALTNATGMIAKPGTADGTDQKKKTDKDAAKTSADAATTDKAGDAKKPAADTADPTVAAAPVPPPADPAAANVVASVLIPAAAAHAPPPKAPTTGEQAAVSATPTADAAKSAPATLSALQINTGNTAKPGQTGKGGQTDKSGTIAASKNSDATNQADASDSADGAQTDHTGASPQADPKAAQNAPADADKQQIAPAHGGTSADGKQPAAGDKPADSHADAGVAAKIDGMTPQIQTTQTQTVTASSASATAPAQTAAQQGAGVPLAGLGVAIASKASDGNSSFDIRLDPPELGRIEVHLDVDKDGHVTSRLIADRSDTLDLLRRDSTGLERALQDAGLKTSDSGMQFSLRDQAGGQQQPQQQQQQNGTHQSRHVVVPDDTLPKIDTSQTPYNRFGTRAGGVDIRV
jgi:flagellar hook-length control protein FliK